MDPTDNPKLILLPRGRALRNDPPPVKRDSARTPDVDWTGHQYKAAADCHVTHYRIGRESSAARR